MTRRNPAIRWPRRLLAIPAVVVGVVVATVLFLLSWGLLLRVRWVSDRTRQLTKRANRYLRPIAGTRWGMLYFNLAALHHVGRRSGRHYMTPLSAYPLGDGFVLALAYPHVDWCENLLAAGKCTLTWNGKDYALERPEVIPPAEAKKAYPLLVKPFLAVTAGQNKFVWLHRAGSQDPEAIVRQYIDAKDNHRWDEVVSLLAPECTSTDPAIPEPVKGIEAISKYFPMLEHVSMKTKILMMASKGDDVAAELAVTCAFEKPSDSAAPPTGLSFVVEMAKFYKVNSKGLLVDEREYSDPAAKYASLEAARSNIAH